MKAHLIIASSDASADLFWATRFYTPDPIVYLEHRGKKILVASDLELSRARREAEVDLVLPVSRYESRLKKSLRKRREGDLLDVILRERRIRSLEVPADFPLRQAEILKKRGYAVRTAQGLFYPERQIKSAREKSFIVQTLRATEEAIRTAIEVLRRSKIKGGKIYRNGTMLTSEGLRRVIESTLMEQGALGQHTIVSCGRQSADPHCRGTGPLTANQPIVLDVFPKSVTTGYYGDITRTVLRGRASETLQKMYAAVRRGQEAGIAMIRDGANGSKVHQAVATAMEKAGFKTETVRGRPQGFIHSTGHGLGLEIHEPPRIGRLPGRLKKGNIVTVEPGLYYEDLGGIRIEDVVFVTRTGCDILTKIPKVFEIY